MEMLSEHQMPGLARRLSADRPARLLLVLRGVHPHHRFDVQSARQVAQGVQPHPLAAADRVAQLPAVSSHVWRQDHNGFSHQDPGFIDHVVNKKAEVVRVYLPPDANTLLSVTDHCLRSRNYVNVIVAGKQPAPQWLTMDQADQTLHRGHRHLGIGQQRQRQRARCRDGLLRGRADARDAGGRGTSPRAPAGTEGPRHQRREPDEAAAAERTPAWTAGPRFRCAVHEGQADHLRLPWISMADSSAHLSPYAITTTCTCAATRKKAPRARHSTWW